MKKSKKRRSNKKRCKAAVASLAAFVMIYIVCAAIFFLEFNKFLTEYEETQLSNISAAVIPELRSHADLFKSPVEFETDGDASSLFLSLTDGKELKLEKKIYADFEERPLYYLFADGKYVASCYFKKCAYDGRFIKESYKFDTLESLAGYNYAVSFLLPSNHSLYLNGKLVNKEKYTKESHTVDDYGRCFDKSSFDGKMLEYNVSGLSRSPEAKVVDERGKAAELIVKSTDGQNVSTVGFKEASFRVPTGHNVFINGKNITSDKSFFVSEEISDMPGEEIRKYLGKYVSSLPTYSTYTVKYLHDDYEAVITDEYGNVCKSEYDEKSRFYSVTYDDFSGNEKPYTDIIKEISALYSRYVTRDAVFKDISPYLLKDTDVYEILNPANDMIQPYFYSKHIGYRFENYRFSGLRVYSEDLFECSARYTHVIIRTESDTRYFECAYNFVMTRKNGKWYLLDYSLLPEETQS